NAATRPARGSTPSPRSSAASPAPSGPASRSWGWSSRGLILRDGPYGPPQDEDDPHGEERPLAASRTMRRPLPLPPKLLGTKPLRGLLNGPLAPTLLG